jgi:formyltetrahydrofolate-dependent phosphoribosylglycinamide formyltransferase
MTARKRTAILISGRGSNMTALIAAARADGYPAAIATVISNRPDAKGLDIAASLGVATRTVDHRPFASRDAFDAELDRILTSEGIELVALAGFMRIMTPGLVESWRDRMINIHPSLLPSYRGLHTHERAIADGVRIHGCTVHFVRHDVDTGPIIAQAAVPVLPGDTPDDLAARVLKAEHRLYPQALGLVASGDVWVEGDRLVWRAPYSHDGVLVVPPPDARLDRRNKPIYRGK